MRPLFALLIFVLACGLSAQSFDSVFSAGSTNPDGAYGCAVDGAGNVTVAGNFSGMIDLDPGPALDLHSALGMGLFVLRLDASGAKVWARSISAGPGGHVGSEDMCLDAAGNVYVAGAFRGDVDFDPGAAVQLRTSLDVFNTPSPNNTFVLKLDDAGNFGWVSTFRGDANIASSITAGPGGKVHVAGLFNLDMDMDPGAGAVIATALGSLFNTYLLTLDAAGNRAWHLALNSGVGDAITCLDTDIYGSVYTCGSFVGSVNFNPQGTAFVATATAYVDAYIARYSATGQLQWLRHYGVSAGNGNMVQGLYVEGTDLYATGNFRNTVDFDHTAASAPLTSAGGEDGFVLKLDITGGFGWVRGLHGGQNVQPRAIAGDGTNLWVSGGFLGSADFDPGTGTTTHDATAGGNGFVLCLSPAGERQWSCNFGTTHTTTGTGGTFPATSVYGMAALGSRVAICGSFFTTADFGGMTANSAGLGDAFVATLTGLTTPGGLFINSPPPAIGTVGVAAAFQLSATGGTGTGYSWSLVSGSLPPGISGLPASGTPGLSLGGVPATVGSFSFRVRVQDSALAYTERTYTWTIQTSGLGTGAATVGGGGCVAGPGGFALLPLVAVLLRRRRRCT